MAIASQKIGVKALVPIDPVPSRQGFTKQMLSILNFDGGIRFTSALAVDLSKTIYGCNKFSNTSVVFISTSSISRLRVRERLARQVLQCSTKNMKIVARTDRP